MHKQTGELQSTKKLIYLKKILPKMVTDWYSASKMVLASGRVNIRTE